MAEALPVAPTAGPAAGPKQRLFFALWPDAAVANCLDAAAAAAHAACGGRRMRGDSLHLTLAFLGEVPADRADAAESAAASAAAELVGVTFQLRLNRLGYWRHNRILWAGTDSESAPLLALVDKLAAHLRDAGFALESRRFAAHVTLLRDAQCQDLPGLNAPIEWPVSDFVLAESQLSARGARYRVRHRWSLRTMPA